MEEEKDDGINRGQKKNDVLDQIIRKTSSSVRIKL